MEQAIDLHFDLRNVLTPLGEYQRTFDFLRDAEMLATALDDQRRLGWVYAYRTAHFLFMGNHDRVIEAGQCALALAGPQGDIACQVAARFFLGTVYYNLGEYRRVIDDIRQTIALLQDELLYERFGLIGIASVWCRTILVQSLAECGVFSEAMAHGEEAVRIA